MGGSIWLDGRLVDGAAPHLAVTDRGFQLGDGIFETARARRGVVIELDEHLRRLHESAEALAIHLPVGRPDLVDGIRSLLAAEDLDGSGGDGGTIGDAALRITVSRGSIAQRGLLPAGVEAIEPTVVIQAWPYTAPTAAILASGLRAIPSAVRRDPLSPLAGIKSTSRADYVYAKLEAARAGADDALFLTTDRGAERSHQREPVDRHRPPVGDATAVRRGAGRHDTDVAPGTRRRARPRTRRGGHPTRRPARGRRGDAVVERGRDRAADRL